jgi:renalase
MENDNAIKVVTLQSTEGYVASYDAVVITIPVPQMLALDGISPLLDLRQKLTENLKTVSYSSRYAVALHFDSNFIIPVPWTAKYVSDNSIIRFVCWDSKKRNPSSGTAPSLLVHSTVEFALEHLEEEREKVEDIIVTQTQMLFPWLPKPLWSRCHRWRYSQVTNSYPGKPGFLTIAKYPPVVVCGDGFTQSNFDGCVESAEKVVNAVCKLL